MLNVSCNEYAMNPNKKNTAITSYPSGQPYPLFSGASLKAVAVLTMLIDHFAAVVISGFVSARYARLSQESLERLGIVYEWMRHIGRMAFPIFVFLVVEGFYHTRDKKKYAARLLLFAALSEIPYDLAVCGRFCDWRVQNTLFTLFFGLLVIWLMDTARFACETRAERRKSGKNSARGGKGTSGARGGKRARNEHGSGRKNYVNYTSLLQLAIAAAGCGIAYVCRLDYRWQGIALIALFYLLRQYRSAAVLGGFCALPEGIPWSAPAFLMLFLYNGRRGRKGQKWLYLFYPVHLLALYGMLQVILLR